MFEALKQMNQELADLKQVHLEKSKVLFSEVAKQLFEKHPELKSFSWRQYTPYFNDGEECTFSAHTDDIYLNDCDEDYPQFDKAEITNYAGATKAPYPMMPNPLYNPALALAEKDAKEFLSNIDDSVLRDLFGDHVKVTVSDGGTEVEEYEHD